MKYYKKKKRCIAIFLIIFLFGMPIPHSSALVCSSLFSWFSRDGTHENSIPKVGPQDITIIGAGAFGTTIASILALEGNHVEIWGRDENTIHEINQSHTNPKLVDESKAKIPLPETLKGVLDLEKAVDRAEIIFLAVTSKGEVEVAKQLATIPSIRNEEKIIVSLDKGFVYGAKDTAKEHPRLSLDILSEILRKPREDLVYIAGPDLAKEIMQGVSTVIVIASGNPQNAATVRKVFGKKVNIEETKDFTGVEVYAAAKNSYAILYGILEISRQYNHKIGINTLAQFFSKALVEMTVLAKKLSSGHSYKSTALGPAGIGDLYVTCMGGRNALFGITATRDFYKTGKSFRESMKATQDTLEGIEAARAIHVLAAQKGISLPINETLYRILYEDASLEDEIPTLLRLFGKQYPNGSHFGSWWDKVGILSRKAHDFFVKKEGR